MKLHPKIRNAAIAAVLLGLLSVGNAVVNVYPNAAWVQILLLVLPVLAGYQTPSPKP